VDAKLALAGVIRDWFRRQCRIAEPVNITLVEGPGEGFIRGKVFFGDGVWHVMVKKALPLDELRGVLLHELGHIVTDGRRLRSREVRGVDLLLLKWRTALEIEGRNRHSGDMRNYIGAHAEDRGYQTGERLADSAGDVLAGMLAKEARGG